MRVKAMCVCVYACMYVCMYYVCKHHVCTYVFLYVCIGNNLRILVCQHGVYLKTKMTWSNLDGFRFVYLANLSLKSLLFALRQASVMKDFSDVRWKSLELRTCCAYRNSKLVGWGELMINVLPLWKWCMARCLQPAGYQTSCCTPFSQG